MGMYPDWSPDGSKIVHDFEAFIAIVDLAEGGELQLPVEGLGPSWSPDGQRIAFASFTNGRTIFTMSPDGSDVRELGPGNEPAWGP
jgi:Tol biopolymer transport system component